MKAKTIKPPRLEASLNGCTLTGEQIDGKWKFKCKEFPDLAEKFDGVENANAAIEEFQSRAVEMDGKRWRATDEQHERD